MKPNFTSIEGLTFFWRVLQARPGVFGQLMLWHTALYTVFAVILAVATPDTLGALNAASQGEDAEALVQAFANHAAAAAPYLPISFAIGVFMEAAWLRLFTRGDHAGPFPFRAGRDELAYVLALLAILAALLVAYIAGSMIVYGLAALNAGLGAFGVLVFLVALLALSVRVSVFTALAVRRGRASLKAAWTGAGAIFWSLTGAYVLATIAAIFIAIVLMVVISAAGLGAPGPGAGWTAMIAPLAAQTLMLALLGAIFRGVAAKAAIAIDEAETGTLAP